VAPSSSARKVAKLASRGKGKKVRFSGGTTFPVIVVAVGVAMLGLIVYAKVSLPGESTGSPTSDENWSIAYGVKVCDEWLPNLTGRSAELTEKDASTGDPDQVANGGTDADGIIHYHPLVGGNTGGKAKLGVFLDVYDISLNDNKLELPQSQVGEGETRSWDVDDGNVFDGTACEGKNAVIKVRVWRDYTTGAFEDKITDFRNLRFTNNGMVFAIAVVPEDESDFEINKPDSAAKLDELGVLGEGSGTTDTTVPPETTGATDTTVATDSTVAPDTTGAPDTTESAPTTTTG